MTSVAKVFRIDKSIMNLESLDFPDVRKVGDGGPTKIKTMDNLCIVLQKKIHIYQLDDIIVQQLYMATEHVSFIYCDQTHTLYFKSVLFI